MSELKPRFFFILAVVVVAALFCIPPDQRPLPEGARKWLSGYKIHLGLDLRGGVELIYQIPEQAIKSEHESTMSDTVAILRDRIEKSGIVAEPDVRRRGHNEIQIQLPDLTEEEALRIEELLQRMGKLEFRLASEMEEEEQEWPKFEQVLGKTAAQRRSYHEELEKVGRSYGGKNRGYRWYPNAEPEAKRRWRLLVIWERDENGKKVTLPVFDGSKIESVGLDTVPEVRPTAKLKDQFAHEFGVFTENHKGQPMAIVYDDEVVSDPTIEGKLDGAFYIKGLSPNQARNLKTIMQSGKLDVKPILVAKNGVEPSLGSDAIERGLLSVAIGLGLVFLIVLVYYRLPGAMASVALILNLSMLYAALVLTGATLTLPGIAGFILTVGMSIDANIIIFERIREERGRGKTLDQAVRNGFDRAFLTIVDANVTTLITAAVLYFVGSGPVQGFAVTLFWGIACSMFTALFVVKTLLFGAMKGGLMTEFDVMRLVDNPNVAFVGKRHAFMLASVAVIVVGMFFFVDQGEDIYGIEIKGGMQVQARFQHPKETEEIRAAVNEKFPNAHVQALAAIVESEAVAAESRQYAVNAQHLPVLGEGSLVSRRDELLGRLAKIRAEMKEDAAGKKWWLDSEESALIEALEMILVEAARAEAKEGETVYPKRPKYTEGQMSLAYLEAFFWTAFGENLAPEVVTAPRLTPEGDREKYEMTVHLTQDRPWIDLENALREQGYAPGADFTVEPVPGWGQAEADEDLAKRIEEARGDPDAKSGIEARHFRVTLTTSIDERDVFSASGEEETLYKQLAPDESEWRAWFVHEAKAQAAGAKVQQALRAYEKGGEKIFAEVFSNAFPTSANVGGSVSDRQKTDAFWAIIGSLTAVLIYIAFRFQWRFGVAAIVALVHDVTVTLGGIAVFAMMGWVNVEINLPVIAALLTIIGYSLNDTIIMYDRIRENLEIGAITDFPTLVNTSINQTLSRTLGTSLTTLVVVLAMFVITYGAGGMLEGFSFTMIVGLIAGTYSSVYIAAPILVDWYLRDKTRTSEAEAARGFAPPPKPKEEPRPEAPKAKAEPQPPQPPAAGPSPALPPPTAEAEEEGEEEEDDEAPASAPAVQGAPKGGTQTKPKGGKTRKKKKKKKRR